MKKLLALALVVFGLAACQTEPEGFDVTVNGEVPVTVTVDLADAVGTRANSAEGAIDNGVVDSPDYTLRYALQVFNENGTASKAIKYKYSENTSVAFDLRLVPNRNYKFVVWADIVDANQPLTEDVKCDDLHYAIGADLRNITLNNSIIAWEAMDETRDAYTGVYNANNFNAAQNITIKLTRPFAKLRVVTTDIAELFDGVVPAQAVATYTTKHRTSFDAFAQKAGDAELSNVQHTFTIAGYNEGDADTINNKTLFVDYFFAADQDDVVNFTLDVKEANGTTIKKNTFNTPIPVKRNFLTTIKGNVLTEGNKISIDIDDNFGENQENQENWGTISSQAEFNAAVAAGGLYKVINLITLTNSGAGTTAVRFAATPAAVETVIDLNGYTITAKNTGNTALITVADDSTLTFTGEGNVVLSSDSTGALIDNNGTVNIEGGTFENENTTGNVSLIDNTGGTTNVNGGDIATDNVIAGGTIKTTSQLLADLFANGGELTLGENIEISEPLLVTTANPIVINGANKTLTSSAARAIRATVDNANIVVNDLNIDVTTERVGTNDIRGISIDILTGVELTLNNCSVNFSHPSGNDYAYAVNVTGGSNHNVTINGGTYNGANVINVRGANNTIVVKNATLTSLYPIRDIYGACIWVLQKQNSSVYAEGNTFNGDNALAFNLGTGTALEEKNNTDNTKYVVANVNGAYYYNIAEAIAAAENNATITVLHSFDCTVGATVDTGKTLTLDLNGKTVEGTDTITGSFGLITNKGNLTVKNGRITLKAENNRGWNAYSSVISNNPGGNLVVENVTIEHLGGTDMAYGIDNLTNGKGTSAITYINDGAVVKSVYRAVRQFLNGVEATNELYINAGAKIVGENKSVWLQDPNANANSGKIVVEEGAELYGDVYLSVTAGSTEWPVKASIADSAVKGEVLTNNVPEGYDVVLENGVWTVVRSVAKIGETEYTSLQEAVNAAQNGDTVLFVADVEQEDGVIITDKNITIDLNGNTFTVSNGANTNNRNFKVNGSSVVTIKNGTMVAAGNYSSGAYGTLRTEGTANVTLEGVKLYNYRGNGLNVKALSGTTVTVNDTEIYSQYGGGIESAGGIIELTNVKVEQKGMYTAPYNSMAISVNGGGTVTVNSGTYSTECITAEEAYNQGTSHGPWCAGVLNSGGTLIIKGGTFSNDNFGENTLATAARGLLLADTGANIQVQGGTFNAVKAIVDIQNNLGDASKNPSATISGGNFSANPLTWEGLIKVAAGYKVVEENGIWTVVAE
ncbi:MAG: hypothetical protein IKA81_01440 [Alistipes sp.]|nr:hypothetical protein [Alistipes sp.]